LFPKERNFDSTSSLNADFVATNNDSEISYQIRLFSLTSNTTKRWFAKLIGSRSMLAARTSTSNCWWRLA